MGPAGREKTAEKTLENPQRQWREFVSEKGLHASKTRELVVDIFLKQQAIFDERRGRGLNLLQVVVAIAIAFFD